MKIMLKIIGVIFIVLSCGGVGYSIAYNYKKEEKSLRTMVHVLDYMSSELQYRLTALPQLCRLVAETFPAVPGNVFLYLANELELQDKANPALCMTAVLSETAGIPPITYGQLQELGRSLGFFDLEGQLKGIQSVKEECERQIKIICENKESRLRSYQTLGLCAGAALAILFV